MWRLSACCAAPRSAWRVTLARGAARSRLGGSGVSFAVRRVRGVEWVSCQGWGQVLQNFSKTCVSFAFGPFAPSPCVPFGCAGCCDRERAVRGIRRRAWQPSHSTIKLIEETLTAAVKASLGLDAGAGAFATLCACRIRWQAPAGSGRARSEQGGGALHRNAGALAAALDRGQRGHQGRAREPLIAEHLLGTSSSSSDAAAAAPAAPSPSPARRCVGAWRCAGATEPTVAPAAAPRPRPLRLLHPRRLRRRRWRRHLRQQRRQRHRRWHRQQRPGRRRRHREWHQQWRPRRRPRRRPWRRPQRRPQGRHGRGARGGGARGGGAGGGARGGAGRGRLRPRRQGRRRASSASRRPSPTTLRTSASARRGSEAQRQAEALLAKRAEIEAEILRHEAEIDAILGANPGQADMLTKQGKDRDEIAESCTRTCSVRRRRR